MNSRKGIYKTAAFMLAAGMLATAAPVSSKAAVISSNATDKLAVIFHEGTAYSAGDYVIYDGEMYICTEDIQGAWSQAESSFMQVTKNKELGQAEDLSAVYAEEKDPSEEKSLMAFAANAWQKLKGFLGIGSRDTVPDASAYRNASVSEKLNYLENQNQSQSEQLGGLQKSVMDSFQSVSNGKSLIADAITDNNGTKLGPHDPFGKYSQAVRDMAQKKYNSGVTDADNRVNKNSASYKEGYDKGIVFADGRSDVNSASYKDGYNKGMAFADGRVNTGSVSYEQGKNDGRSESSVKTWSAEAVLRYGGIDEEKYPQEVRDCFSYTDSDSADYREWWFHKDLGGEANILGIYATVSYTDSYGSSSYLHVSVKKNGNKDDQNYHVISTGTVCELTYRNGRIWLSSFRMYPQYQNSSYVSLKLMVLYI